MRRIFPLAASAIVLALVAVKTQAQTVSTENKTISKVSLGLERLKEHFGISYFSIFDGPTVGNFGGQTSDNDGNVEEDNITNWLQVSMQFFRKERFQLVINPRFEIDWVNPSNSQLLEPVIGVNGTWFRYGKLSFSGSINTIFPVQRSEDTTLVNPGGFNSITYEYSPNVQFGSWVWFRFYFENDMVLEDVPFENIISPFVTYAFNDKLSVTGWIDYFNESVSKDQLFTQQSSGPSKASLGVSYNIARQLNLQPNITVIPSNLSIDTTQISAWISGRLF